MRKSQTRTGRRPLRVVAAAAVATTAVVAGTAAPALAAAYTLSTTQVAVAGGTVLYLTGGSAFADTQGIRFALSANACPAAYDTVQTGAVNGGLIKAVNANTAYVTTPPLPAGTYKPCLYTNATTGLLDATDTTAGTVTAVNFATLSPTTGQAADKVTLTASTGIYTGASYSTEFVSGVTACPATYTTPSATAIAATTVKTSTTVLTVTVPTLVVGTSYLVCSYVGTSAGVSALAVRSNVSFASFGTTLPAVTPAPSGGSSGTATTVTLSVPTASAVFTGSPDVLVTRNSCPFVRPATSALGATTGVEPYAASVTKISNSKLAVTMPTTVIVGGADATTAWNTCVYASNSTGAALVAAPSIYTVAPVLDVTGAQFAVGGGAPSGTGSGPAQGGSQITVSGLTGIPTTPGALLSANLGGSPITITTVNSSTSFTGTTSAHAAGPVKLSVTTAGGTKTTTLTPYTYTYGVTVTPNTASSGSTPVLDITGAGFGSLTFADVTAAAPAANTSYVLLTDNDWHAQTFTNLNAMATAPVSYCNTVLPISDTEIICTLDLANSISGVAANVPTIAAGTPVPEGTYTVTVVNDADDLDSADADYSIVSSGSTFTVAAF